MKSRTFRRSIVVIYANGQSTIGRERFGGKWVGICDYDLSVHSNENLSEKESFNLSVRYTITRGVTVYY